MNRTLASAFIVLALLLGLPANAQAETRGKTECSDGVCMTVYRDGTFVRNIVPSVNVAQLQRKFGHTETRGPGFHHNSLDRWFYNVSGTTPSSQAAWLGYSLNRHYPKGSLFCTRFWTKIDGRYYSPGDECVRL